MTTAFAIRIASTPEEIDSALRIRERIFVQEQRIPAALDDDGLDASARHVLAYDGDRAIATGRLVADDEVHGTLARIAVLPEYRGRGLGRRVVAELEALALSQGLETVTLQPHTHLERFYEQLGYERSEGTSVAGEHELLTMTKRLV